MDERDTVEFGQSPVRNDYVVNQFARVRETGRTVGNPICNVAGFRQAAQQELARARIIFNQQDPHEQGEGVIRIKII